MNTLITIAITTRNRFQDLNETLDKLVQLGLNNLPMIIYDDASDEPIASPDKLKHFTTLKIVKNDVRKGLIYNRNRIVENATTSYIISLDDDSCFAHLPPLKEAVEYLESHPCVAALEFNNIDIKIPVNRVVNQLNDLNIYAVKSYTGCGHMIRRSTFLELGSYREYFFQMTEETDWGQRAWQQGYEIHTFPSIVVHHRRTPTSRVPARLAFYNARNVVLCNLLNKPLLTGIIRSVGVYPVLLSKNIRYPKLLWNITLGLLNGFLSALAHWNERTPMAWSRYRAYQQLPSLRFK